MNHLIFDLDGTLVNSAESIRKALIESCQINNIAPRVPICDINIGPPLSAIIRDILPTEDTTLRVNLRNTFLELYDGRFCKQALLYPGAIHALSQAMARSDLFVVTNKRIAPTKTILHHLNILQLFKGVLGSDSVVAHGLSKAKMINHLINSFELCRSNCAYFGDTESDAEACEEVGISFFYASWGYGDMKSNHHIMTSWDDLHGLITRTESNK
ncbi:HAD family hydrolase [Luminiphilus sp.]|jgi:phosphoglycolate phosphatase|nr:HAD family hydrolase [Luminiphilus sp.]